MTKILVVDDHADLLALVVRRLQPGNLTYGGHQMESSARRAARRFAVLGLVTCLGLGWVAATLPAGASVSYVTIKTIASKSASEESKAKITPRYSVRKKVSVRSATLTVTHGSRTVAKKVRSVKLAPGSYGVTTQVTYRVRSAEGKLGRVRTATKAQTLRITPWPSAPAIQPQPESTPLAPKPAPTPTPTEEVPEPSTTATPEAEGVSGPACGGTTLRKQDGSRWVCTFTDEFEGSALDRDTWAPQQTATSGYQLGGDCFVDRPDNISVGDGALSLTVREEAEPFTCSSPGGDYTSKHTSGTVTTWNSFAQSTGRFEIRAAFPDTKVPGHHSALWLYPKEPREGGFPYSGEIDIGEMYSQWNDRVIPFIHYPSGYDPTVTNNFCLMQDVSQFHTYTLVWTATTMTIQYDGKPCLTHTINGLNPEQGSAPFDKTFMLVLTQGLGLGDNSETEQTPDTGTTKIDYVRVWQ
ncbi:MAG: glycoside hydrolase family 16 protein [Aeromicrobium sp.]